MGKQSLKGFSATAPVDDPISIIATQGAFYGASLPAPQIEAMIASHVPKKHFKEVADVQQTKWWDYRRLSPGHSFYLFAHHYYRESRTAARKVVSEKPTNGTFRDGERSKKWGKAVTKEERQRMYQFAGPALVEMSVEDIWERDQAHITGMFNAMLVADALGIPYDEYVRLSCRVAIDNLWKRLPRPSQLYGEKLGAMVWEEWEQLLLERFKPAKHPLFLVENYEGTDLQDEYRTWLIDHIGKLGSGLIPALMQVVYQDPQLPADLAEQHFPKTALNRARLLAG